MGDERAKGTGSKVITTKLFVGNLPETCRRVELLEKFERFGKVAECDIIKDYAFVHFIEPEDAKAAAAAMDGAELNGSNIKVELSHSRVRQKPGMGGKSECYRCGEEGHWSKDCHKNPGYRGRGMKGGPPNRPDRPDPYLRTLRDPYPRDPYAMYRDRYPPPPPLPDRYRVLADPYERRLPPRDPYYRDTDPYARPPPDYYRRTRSPPRDPYYDLYYRRPAAPLPSRPM